MGVILRVFLRNDKVVLCVVLAKRQRPFPSVFAGKIGLFQLDRRAFQFIAVAVPDVDEQLVRTVAGIVALPDFLALHLVRVVIVQIKVELDVDDVCHEPPVVKKGFGAEIPYIIHGQRFRLFLGGSRQLGEIEQILRVGNATEGAYRLGGYAEIILEGIVGHRAVKVREIFDDLP